MPVNPSGYVLDLLGTNPDNHIVDDVYTFTSIADRAFVPAAGPFYVTSLVVRNAANSHVLQPQTDYKALHLHVPAAMQSGKNVCAIVYVTNPAITAVSIEYRVIGGEYSETSSVIRQLLLDHPIDGSVEWEMIVGQPVQYPPAAHFTELRDVYGMGRLVQVLEALRVSILGADGAAFQAVYQYLYTLITNLDYVTQDQLSTVAGGSLPRVITYSTYINLRAAEGMIPGSTLIYAVLGKTSVNDRLGKLFIWDATSLLVDDNKLVIRPDSVLSSGDPGRFIAFMDVDGALANIRSILADNGLSQFLITLGAYADDLDDLSVGKRYYNSSATHRPGRSDFATGLIETEAKDADAMVQTISSLSTAAIARRRYTLGASPAWSPWEYVAFISDINTGLTTAAIYLVGNVKSVTGVASNYTYTVDEHFIAASIRVTSGGGGGATAAGSANTTADKGTGGGGAGSAGSMLALQLSGLRAGTQITVAVGASGAAGTDVVNGEDGSDADDLTITIVDPVEATIFSATLPGGKGGIASVANSGSGNGTGALAAAQADVPTVTIVGYFNPSIVRGSAGSSGITATTTAGGKGGDGGKIGPPYAFTSSNHAPVGGDGGTLITGDEAGHDAEDAFFVDVIPYTFGIGGAAGGGGAAGTTTGGLGSDGAPGGINLLVRLTA